MWRDTRLIVLVAQTAAVYAAILIPFKMGIPLIPGFAELRPANAFPIVASLLFGPVAAWGAGFGNLIGDCFGTLGPGSLFGFIGNFCYGYIPYLLWGRMGPLSSGQEPDQRSWRPALEFALICVAASFVCAFIVGWGVDLLGLLPFMILAPAIFLNNLVMAVLLAPPLLWFLYPRVKRWGLRYEDIVKREMLDVRRDERFGEIPSATACHPSLLTGHPFLSVGQVSFTYAGASRPALTDLSLTASPGEALAVMGRSGSGKSTLCYALNGLVPQMIAGAWAGRLIINGKDTLRRRVWEQADTVGLVFQDFEAQLVSSKVEWELAFPLENLGPTDFRGTPQNRQAMKARIRRTLDLVGLAGLEPRNPLSLSGGQRQRLVIASILIRQPGLVALDEPLTDLDPAGRRRLELLLRDLRTAGTTLILAEQDPEEATSADRILVLDQGRKVWEGSPRSLFSQPTLATSLGVSPLPLAECFSGWDGRTLPLTVEEAWQFADEEGLTLVPQSRHENQERPPAGRPVIQLDRVGYEYDRGSSVLSDLTLSIHPGEFLAIIGPNGSGKSTLAKMLNGLLLPTTGQVLIQGEDTRRLGVGKLAGLVGYVFQNPDHQIFAETVEQEVAFGVHNLGYASEACEQRVASALHAVGFSQPEIRKQDPFSLTKGDRQRVAVASVLAARPPVLIFDEPTTGLDAEEAARMMRMLDRLNQLGHTILIITHSLGLVAAHARRCLVMEGGHAVADGPTREVFHRLGSREGTLPSGLELPPITRFAARWGQTLLTVAEVRAALRRP